MQIMPNNPIDFFTVVHYCGSVLLSHKFKLRDYVKLLLI